MHPKISLIIMPASWGAKGVPSWGAKVPPFFNAHNSISYSGFGEPPHLI